MLIISPLKLIAEDTIPEELKNKEYTKTELIEKVYYYADLYNVDSQRMLKIINCENKEWDVDLQSRIINSKGIREESYGLSQIHLPSHPNVTLEQATDPIYSIEFLAKNLGKVKWSCDKKSS